MTYLRNYAVLNVKDRLARINGVGQVQLFGSGDYSMRVWLDPQKVAERGLSAGDVVRAIREQILVAFKDVEDQLSALRLLAEQSEAQSRSVASATRATVLSDSRYRNGFVSQLELLDAQRSELRNRRQALQVKTSQYLATVGLIRALGGGWTV